MKKFIESKGALQFVRASLQVADSIHYDYHFRKEKCAQELKLRKAKLRNAAERFRECGDMPCGHQDMIGDQLDAAVWNLDVYVSALRIASGVMSKKIIQSFERAIGQ